MGKKRNGRNRKWVDKGSLAVLVAFGVGAAVLVFFMVKSLTPGKEEARRNDKPQATTAATEEPPVDEADISRYICVISEEDDGEEGSRFCMELNEKTGTYRELINSGDSSSEIDRGTFQKEEDGIRMEGRRGNQNVLLYEGEYLVSKNALFKGNVPEGKTFDKVFSHKVEGESEIVTRFKKNGTFSQKVIRYRAGLDGKDTSKAVKGTYVRKGKFIERTGEDGVKLMPYYIYKNRLCTSYYKKSK